MADEMVELMGAVLGGDAATTSRICAQKWNALTVAFRLLDALAGVGPTTLVVADDKGDLIERLPAAT